VIDAGSSFAAARDPQLQASLMTFEEATCRPLFFIPKHGMSKQPRRTAHSMEQTGEDSRNGGRNKGACG
jgi:hypothetical protein